MRKHELDADTSQDLLAAQDERRARWEQAQATGEPYKLEFWIPEDRTEEAVRLAERYRDLQNSSGVLGAIKKRLLLRRTESKLAYMVQQIFVGNKVLAGAELESGLLESYSPEWDRKFLARKTAALALGEGEGQGIKKTIAW